MYKVSTTGTMSDSERAPLDEFYVSAGSRREAPGGRFVIDPRKSQAIGYWDGVAGIALLFTATVTPYEVGFLQPVDPSERATDGLFLCNRVVDVVFVVDMLLQFVVAYQVKDARTGVRWVLDGHLIACHYLFSRWFLLDAFSISTSAFDIFDAGGSSDLFVLRALRALRLIKLVRLARGSRMLQRWEKRISINYAYLGLIQSVVAILISSHWFACIWGLQASFDRLGTWLGATEYCRPLPSNGSAVDAAAASVLLAECPAGFECEFSSCLHGVCTGGTVCEGPFTVYTAAFYFVAVTTTSVGYGDIHATAFHPTEQFITTLIVLFGGALWASLVGTFCGLAAQLDPDVRERRERLSVLNAFMTDAGLPPFLRFRLREFLFEAADVYKASRAKELLEQVSPALQGEVALTVSVHRLECVWYLRSTPTVLKIELASQLRPLLLPQGEQAPPGFMYILERGTALYQGKVLRAPAVWGEDILLNHEPLQLHFAATAMSYTWVWLLDAEAFTRVFEEFPQFAAPLHCLRRKWRCRRMVVRAAEQALFTQGKSFYVRLYPIIGRGAMSSSAAAPKRLLGKEGGGAAVVSESDLLEDELPLADAGRPTPARSPSTVGGVKGHGRVAAVAAAAAAPFRAPFRRARRGAAERASSSDPALAHRQKLIENAARLFGAQKMRQANQGDKAHQLQAHARLQADVSRLAAGMEALTADMRVVMGALHVDQARGRSAHAKYLEA